MAMLDRPPRARKSTLDTFNDELAVLDRPLEGDVEYADEAPRPSRMRGVALFAGVVLGMGLAGGAILSRRHAAAPPSAQAAQPARPGGTGRGRGTADGRADRARGADGAAGRTRGARRRGGRARRLKKTILRRTMGRDRRCPDRTPRGTR